MNERWVIARVNRMVYFVSLFIGLALCGGYFFDYISSEVPPVFYFAFVGTVAVQQICNTVIYFRDNGSPRFKYAALIGYFAVYVFVMLGRIDALLGLNEDSIALYVYVVIVPALILYIGYYDMKLLKVLAIGTVIVNILKVAFHIYIGYTDSDNFSEYMVQLGLIAITIGSVYTVARITYENHMIKLKETEEAANQAHLEREKSEAVTNAMKENITYASKIQRNLLPQDKDMASKFSDHSVIWKPRDIVGGDVYWMKHFDTGVVLCVADCTGHGTPGALLTTLVTSALESIVWEGNCDDTADIMWRLDRRLASVLHVDSDGDDRHEIMHIDDGCDIVVIFVAHDKSVQFSNSNIPVFVCDGNEVVHYKGQKLFIGEGKINSRDEVSAVNISANQDNKFYIASDGLFDQIGKFEETGVSRGKQYGYDSFKQTILKHHKERQAVITEKIWDEYEQYRGEEAQRDDFELVAFQP